MAKREKLEVPQEGNYFVNKKSHLFVSSGCTKLDCDLGGGFPLGRVVNIVGDSSTAKTALACETITNFIYSYAGGRAAYRDAEAAFDKEYAQAMGLPEQGVDLGDPKNRIRTVEMMYDDLDAFLDERMKADAPGIYIIDSLDALSDAAELDRDFDQGSFGATKPKQIGKLFARLTSKIEQSKVLFLIISQTRDKIGVTFGERTTRSGGRALQFYCTQVLWLANLGGIKKTINKQERVIGMEVRANVKKNKIGLAHRKTDFTFHFSYGIEDLVTSLNWLKEVGRLDDIEVPKDVNSLATDEYNALQARVRPHVQQVWKEIETSFLPKRKKYG